MEDRDSRLPPFQDTSQRIKPSLGLPKSSLAESGHVPAKSKRRRRGAPKSRRGCLTCKIRRVKCDEIEPACQKCTKTNRVCDYLEASQKRHPVLDTLAPYTFPLKLRPDYALTASPYVSIDAQNLDYFLKVCCSDFSGFFIHKIWEEVIPQHTANEPSIRYTAMAIGAMHRSHAFQKGIAPASERQRALMNFANSVSALNVAISNNQASRDLVCLASLLFTVFEVIRGNDQGCLMHFYAGMKILQSTPQEVLDNQSGYMYELVSIFSRLDIQAASFAPSHAANLFKTPVIPSEFLCLVQARETLDTIISLMHCVLQPQGQARSYHTRLSTHSPIAREAGDIKSLLAIWLDTFEAFVASRSLKVTQRDHAAATILRISHLYASIFLGTFSVLRQTFFNAYLSQFTKIVEHAAFVIDMIEKTQTHSGQRLAFDIGIVHPLQFVARKCRNRTLRRRAIELTDRSGREGAWDGQNVAKVLRWIVAKEEENLRPTEEEVARSLAMFGDEMPEERDCLHSVQVDFDRLAQKLVIRTSRSRDENNLEGSLEHLQELIPWCGQQVEEDVEVGLITGFMR